MTIAGRFIGGAPFFSVDLRSFHFRGLVWLLADTGASRTTLLDRDVSLLAIPSAALIRSSQPIVGVGGSVRCFRVPAVEFTLASDTGDWAVEQDLWIAQHDLQRRSVQERARIMRLSSVMGRDLINQFRLTCDYPAGVVELSRP